MPKNVLFSLKIVKIAKCWCNYSGSAPGFRFRKNYVASTTKIITDKMPTPKLIGLIFQKTRSTIVVVTSYSFVLCLPLIDLK